MKIVAKFFEKKLDEYFFFSFYLEAIKIVDIQNNLAN
jgi:hypothetical protein